MKNMKQSAWHIVSAQKWPAIVIIYYVYFYDNEKYILSLLIEYILSVYLLYFEHPCQVVGT